jgi:hypothetical protein
LQGAFAATLIIDEKGLATAQQDVARLEITVEEVIARSAEEKIGQAAEIVLETLFIKRNGGESKKIIFEIVQIPGDGLTIEAGAGIADGIIDIAGGFHLETREDGNNLAVGFDDGSGDVCAIAIFREEVKQNRVTEVFFQIRAVCEIFSVDFRDGQAVFVKMAGECKEGDILFANAVENTDGADALVGQANDLAPGTAKFALERLNARGGGVEMLLEEFLENVHKQKYPWVRSVEPQDGCLTIIEDSRKPDGRERGKMSWALIRASTAIIQECLCRTERVALWNADRRNLGIQPQEILIE